MDLKSLPEKMSKMSEKDREKLAKKLDDELETYISSLEASASQPKYQSGWTEENWEEEMEKHPFFATTLKEKDNPESADLSPLMQGIRDLKYNPDENTFEELAVNYKDEGNFHFKNKKYRLAVANYTEGLRLKIPDRVLTTQLLTNRAAAQFHLGNFRSSLLDSRLALRVTPDHVKAILRGAQCSMKLKRPQECVEWCDKGLRLNATDKVLMELRTQALELQKTTERDERKKAVKEKKVRKEEQNLLDAIKSRGISIMPIKRDKYDEDDDDEHKNQSVLDLATLEPSHPAALGKRVHLVEEDGQVKLSWPVLFMYPEYAETDFIEEFCDDQIFEDHLVAMFGPGIERPPWDSEKKYLPNRMKIYYEDQLNVSSSPKLVSVNKQSTLLDVLKDPRCKIRGGTPSFVILVDKSAFQEEFLSKYK